MWVDYKRLQNQNKILHTLYSKPEEMPIKLISFTNKWDYQEVDS